LRPKGHFKYKANDNYFEIINTPEKAYWLGLIAADGCLYKRGKSVYELKLALAESDRDLIEDFKKSINFNGNLLINKHQKELWQNMVGITIGSKKIFDDLGNLGLYPKKSLTILFPTKEQVPEEFVGDFIRGYFDGDGCISGGKKKKSSKYWTPIISFCGTLEFLKSLGEELNKNGIQFKTKMQKRHKNDVNSYSLIFNNFARVQKFHDFIYKNNGPFLKRKKEKMNLILSKQCLCIPISTQ
jgi:intein/homing endonuclease